jgi:hypothetical protein
MRRGVEGLHHALRDEGHGEDHGEGQEHVQRRADEVDPEAADGAHLATGEPAHQRDEHGHPGGGADEVLHAEPHHLREVGHRRLAAVPLPVRVRHERDGGVERRVRRHVAEPRRVHGQDGLEPLQPVHDEEPQEVEREQGAGVRTPARLRVGAHAEDAAANARPAEHAVEAARLPAYTRAM